MSSHNPLHRIVRSAPPSAQQLEEIVRCSTNGVGYERVRTTSTDISMPSCGNCHPYGDQTAHTLASFLQKTSLVLLSLIVIEAQSSRNLVSTSLVSVIARDTVLLVVI